MYRIDPDTVRKITDTADIVEVVGDYVHLIRRGANYVGLCPFHNERTPSFSVNRRKNFCYCFSCKQGGSPVNFIMRKEGLSYPEALRHLAKKYGIEVPERELSGKEKEEAELREAMLLANEWAMSQMTDALFNTEEGQNIGLSYFFGHRQITQEAAKAFHLGYSPDNGHWLVDAAKKKGFDIDILTQTGLIGTSREGRKYDRYRGRVIFPILNNGGKVIGFGGRTLKNDQAKYINSSDSLIYKKSVELYGLYQARSAIKNEDKCFLVEGYFDVIGMWQSGMKNVVASSGTALTDGQINLIRRFTKNITLIYDGDAAGIKAALRGVDMLLHHQMDVKVLLLPDGHDPDSFARSVSSDEFRQYVERNETDVIHFKAKVLMENNSNDPQQRIKTIKDMVTTLAHIEDQINRDVYIQDCSVLMNVPETSIRRAVSEKRIELIQQWKRQREYERIQSQHINGNQDTKSIEENHTLADQSSGKGSSLPYSHLNEKSLGSSTVSEAAVHIVDGNGLNSNSNLKHEDLSATNGINSTNSPSVYPFEKQLVEYAIKFGFMHFCDYTDDQGKNQSLSVLEFIEEELHDDAITISHPGLNKVFLLLIHLKDQFNVAYDSFCANLDLRVNAKRKEGIDLIAAKGISVAEITREERQLEESLIKFRQSEIVSFRRHYPGKILTNAEDDVIREIANRLIIDPYQLSNIFSRDNNNVETEDDRLLSIIPRALNELKGEILNIEIKDLKKQLENIDPNNGSDEELEILNKINQKIHQRSMLAKSLGERTLCPK